MAPTRGAATTASAADPILTRLVQQDTVPWYRKRNLRILYLLLLPTCIGIEMTSGFDSQMINTVQISDHWQHCECLRSIRFIASALTSKFSTTLKEHSKASYLLHII